MSLASDIKALVGDRSLYDILQEAGAFQIWDGDSSWIVVSRGEEYAKVIIDPHYGWDDTSSLSLAGAYDVQKVYRRGVPYWVPTDIKAY